MELIEAKEIVKQMYKSLDNSNNYSEAIRLVCSAACSGDLEAIEIQKCIPQSMQYMGLYPNRIKSFTEIPEHLEDSSLKEMFYNIYKSRRNNKK